MGQTPKSELITAMDTHRFLKIPQHTRYRYFQRRDSPAFKLGNEWQFVRSDLERWMQDTQTRYLGNSKAKGL
ncbi:MAG: helix-turn-helix domain-containing protein [Nitrospira sp.]|nr:helix-turn-helix domain-containing protein [Nitrospira sp.]